jgi:hypothetical protein
MFRSLVFGLGFLKSMRKVVVSPRMLSLEEITHLRKNFKDQRPKPQDQTHTTTQTLRLAHPKRPAYVATLAIFKSQITSERALAVMTSQATLPAAGRKMFGRGW